MYDLKTTYFSSGIIGMHHCTTRHNSNYNTLDSCSLFPGGE